MERKKVLIVFGTRPEAIKMAPLVKQFELNSHAFETVVAVTGQHREMLDQVLELFSIAPHYDLNIMQQSQDLYDITTRVLLGMRDVLNDAMPQLVVVHGDTTTSSIAALASFYKQIPVAHIEAGLRTYNKYSPWPEELNRQLTGRIAAYHFAPTSLGKRNLLSENIPEDTVFVTGNTVIDALLWVLHKIETTYGIEQDILSMLDMLGLPKANVNSWKSLDTTNRRRKMVLITGHRRENFGDGFINICLALKTLAEHYSDVDFVYPMHLNPQVRQPIQAVFGERGALKNLFLIDPLDYLPFVYLMNRSYLVLTDSGGIQEEAPGLGKPVLVMRNTTERPEALESGTVRLVGTSKELIIQEVTQLLDNQEHYIKMAHAHNPYGDGKASERIVKTLINL
jgi:UDP-N-acetylglucosamine 2-epimerase (non-hydrolysing)